tara:strand:+ start:5091 stop:5300 length:210 start_codon:yes stop_codon:yes gene_type:complete
MSKIYITIQDDELDQICHDFYGYASGSVELVLEANRDLAKELPYIREGIQIILPEIPKPTVNPTTRLWE